MSYGFVAGVLLGTGVTFWIGFLVMVIRNQKKKVIELLEHEYPGAGEYLKKLHELKDGF